MSFSGMFNDSTPEEQSTTSKREVEVNSSLENPQKSAKKLKSSYVELTQSRQMPENSAETEPDYNSGDYLSNSSTIKQDDIPLQGGNSTAKMETTLRKLGQDAKMSYLKWIQPFGESEAFEAYCPSRLDEILKQAVELEQNLTEQKECLKARLKAVSRTLQIS